MPSEHREDRRGVPGRPHLPGPLRRRVDPSRTRTAAAAVAIASAVPSAKVIRSVDPVVTFAPGGHHASDELAPTVLATLVTSYAPPILPEATPRAALDVNGVYAQSAAGRHDRALDLLFDFFEEALSARAYTIADRTLRSIDVTRLDAHTAVGLLASTFSGRAHLASRSVVLESVRRRLINLGRSEDSVSALLRSLG